MLAWHGAFSMVQSESLRGLRVQIDAPDVKRQGSVYAKAPGRVLLTKVPWPGVYAVASKYRDNAGAAAKPGTGIQESSSGAWGSMPRTELDTTQPITGLLPLVCDGIDIRTACQLSIDDGVRKAPKGVHAKACLGLCAQLLVCFNQLGFGFRVELVDHVSRARIRATASRPGTIATLPETTSSSRRSASSSHASPILVSRSKLSINRSKIAGAIRRCEAEDFSF
jgi:hypothetical protein